VGGSSNNSFKPNLLRSGNGVAGKACHAVACTTQVGLTQALGLHSQVAHRMKKSKTLELSRDMNADEALRAAIRAERTRFLHMLHIFLAGAGLLIGTARLSNQFQVTALNFLIGWPTTLIYLVGATTGAYALYLLLHTQSNKFMARRVSPGTQQALQSFGGCPEIASLGQSPHLTVGDLVKCHAQQT